MTTESIRSALLKILEPQFESYQRQDDDDVGASKKSRTKRCSLSVESRVTHLKNQISTLELNHSVANLSLLKDHHELSNSKKRNNGFDAEVSAILVQYMDAAVGTESTTTGGGGDIQQSIDSVLELIAAFASTYSDTVCCSIVSRAVQYSMVLLERVRVHACNLLGYLVYHLSTSSKTQTMEHGKKGYSWIIESNRVVREALMPRLRDKSQSVRFAAIRACGNFFIHQKQQHKQQKQQQQQINGVDETEIETETSVMLQSDRNCEDDENSDVLQALLWNLSHDPSVSNRLVAVQSVPIKPETVDHIIARTREIKWRVRIQALDTLRSMANVVTDLSETQRVEIIRCGLTDRCNKTREAVCRMICLGWMKTVKYNPIALLKLIDVVNNEEECVKVVNVIMEVTWSDDASILDELSNAELQAFRATVQSATSEIREDTDVKCGLEEIFFSRVVCGNAEQSKTLSSTDRDAIISKILPEVPVLCDIFEQQSNHLLKAIEIGDSDSEDVHSFICMQILQVAKFADLKEEGSRRHFAVAMKRMLSSIETPDELLEGCVQGLKLVHDNGVEIVKSVHEIVQELSTTAESGSECSSGSTENLDDKVILRILSILTVVLEIIPPNISDRGFIAEFWKFIMPSITHSNSLVREAGVSCFGKLGLFFNQDKVLSEYKSFLVEVALREEEEDAIRAQAVLALSDWTMLFDDALKPCAVGDQKGDSDSHHDNNMVSFSDIVSQLLNHPGPGVVAVAAEVAAKLLFSGKVRNNTWIARLLIIYFDSRMTSSDDNDGDEGDIAADVREVGSLVRLQQLLSLFFPAYCVKHELGRNHLTESISLILETLYTKRSKKSKSSWPVIRMIDYICSVVDKAKESDDKAATEKTEAADEGEKEIKGDEAVGTGKELKTSTLSSTTLLAALQVAEFLSCNTVNVSTMRSLCKYLGNVNIEIESQVPKHIVKLKQHVESMERLITDQNCLTSLAKLSEIFVDVESANETEDCTNEEGGSLVEAFATVTINGDNNDKENDNINKRSKDENNKMNINTNASTTEMEANMKRRSPRLLATSIKTNLL